jgi:hypothetical protein
MAATLVPATPLPAVATNRPVVQGQITAAPPAQTYTLWRPLAYTQTLTWNNLITLALLLLLLSVYAATHLTTWRRRLRRWQSTHYRLTAGLQLSGLTLAILALAASSLGQVG